MITSRLMRVRQRLAGGIARGTRATEHRLARGGLDRQEAIVRRLALALIAGGVLAASPGIALAATPPLTGNFSFEDQFIVEPGDTASCAFPISFDLQVRGNYEIFLDAQGDQTKLLLHEHWTGTGTANGQYVIEHAAQTDIVDLVSGANSSVGQIHDQAPFGGVVIHDVGLLSFDGNGNLTFEAGPHQGFDGDPAAIQEFCAALS